MAGWEEATYLQLLNLASKQLAVAGCNSSELDARLLLQAASGFDRSGLIGRGDECCPKEVYENYAQLIARREGREPVHRILGEREFHGLSLKLGSETLEPRDDTECLIESVLERIEDRNASLRFLDLGTGSGAIALALLSELLKAKAVATDVSGTALKVAQDNAIAHHMEERIVFVEGDWFQPVEGKFDFIASNPPYICSTIVDNLEPEVLDHDPRQALDGGMDGLDAYRVILKDASSYLKAKGFLVLEIGYDQLDQVTALGENLGWRLAAQNCDLSGNDRALVFIR